MTRFLKSPLAVLVGAVLLVPAAQAVTDTTAPVTGHVPVVAPKLSTLTPDAGDTVSVTPSFSDPDGDVEDTTAAGTSYQWQVEGTAGSGNYIDITGQTEKSYTIQPTDGGKKLRVMVTPRTAPALTEPFTGQPTSSDIALVRGVPDAVHSAMTVNTTQANNTITADDGTGTDAATKATLTLTLHDAQDKPVKGQSPTFSVTPAELGIKISAVKDNLDGTYTATLTGTKAQDYTVVPQLTGTAFGTGQAQLEGKVSVIAAAVDGPASKVIIPVDAALEGTKLEVQVYLHDKFNNTINSQDYPTPVFTYSSGETLIPGSAVLTDHGSYMLKPAVANNASRQGLLTVVMPDNTVLDNTRQHARPLRWTPLMVLSAVGKNGSTAWQCNSNNMGLLGCPVYLGAQLRIVSADVNAGLPGGSSFIPSGFTVKSASYTNLDSSGVVKKNKNEKMSADITLQDTLTGISQKVSGYGSLFVPYGYKGWASNDNSAVTASAAAKELCEQVGSSGSNVNTFAEMAKYYGKKILMTAQRDGPRVNTYGGGHDTIEYSGILDTSKDNGKWTGENSVTATYLTVSPTGEPYLWSGAMGQMTGPTPVKGSVCVFN